MAGKSLIGSLRVFLGLDAAEFTTGAKKAESSMEGLVENVKKQMEHLAEIFAAKEVLEGFFKINEQIDQLGKAAQKIGIPVDQLSKLQYAAQLADVPFDALQTSIEKFDKGLSQAAATGKGPVAAAFNNMGISIRDAGGHVKDVNSLLVEASAKFASHADGANKSALAIGLFGKAGAAMIPLMNEGAKGIEEASNQLENFGGVVTPQAAESATRLIDTFKIIKMEMYAVALQAVVLIDDALNPLETNIHDLASSKDKIQAWGDYFKNMLIDINESIITEVGDIERLGDAIKYLSFGYGSGETSAAAFKKDLDAVTASVDTQTAHLEDLRNARKTIDRDGQNQASAGVTTLDVHKPEFAPFAAAGVGAAKHKKAIDELAREAKRIWDETRTPLEKYNEKIAELNKLLAAGKITHDTFSRAMDEAKTQYVHAAGALTKYTDDAKKGIDAIAQATDLAKSTMTTWFDSALNGTFNLGNALADLAKNIAKMGFENLLTGLFAPNGGNALYGGGGGGILSKLLGFADGGTIMPSGGGSIDSQVVAFKKRPDEQVDIGTPGQLAAQRSGNSGDVNIHIDARGSNGEASIKAAVNQGISTALAAFAGSLPKLNLEHQLRAS